MSLLLAERFQANRRLRCWTSFVHERARNLGPSAAKVVAFKQLRLLRLNDGPVHGTEDLRWPGHKATELSRIFLIQGSFIISQTR
jgi:hypothetical protein